MSTKTKHPYPYPSYGPSSGQGQIPSYPPLSSKENPFDTVNFRNEPGTSARGRTPSPTPSEQKELKTGAIDWKGLVKWRFWIRREWLWYYVAVVLIAAVTILVTLYHKQIVAWLTPASRWLHDLKFGWLVPIAILFVISFPPLFGHEIVAILCGLVWGLWVGFAIVTAGSLLGDIGNFYAFRYCCRARGEKMEKTNLSYACLAKAVRDGGFKVALIARLSAIPGHFTTAVFSTCGMGIWVYSWAALLSMPKNLITVYVGVILENAADGEVADAEEKTEKLISNIVLAITLVVTVLAMWYIFRAMNLVKPAVIYERRKARQGKLERASMYNMSSASDVALMPYGANPSNANLANSSMYTPRSAELFPKNQLHSPQPQRPAPRISDSFSRRDQQATSDSQNPFDSPPSSPPPKADTRHIPQISAGVSARQPQHVVQHQQFRSESTETSVYPNDHPTGKGPSKNAEDPFQTDADVGLQSTINLSLSPPVYHAAEPTGMSYHTAMGSVDSNEDAYDAYVPPTRHR